MKDVIREALAFKELTPEEKESRGILGRLYGPVADMIKPTRNGRLYDDEVWENIFERNEIIKEMFANGGIPGELDHPADRTELCSEKIAIIMPEKPKKDDKGHLIGYFDILDTPNGRIVYQLAKYGYKLGISSRGNGDVRADGSVDPDTYEFKCFDIVIIPSVKDARLKMTESLDTNMLNMKKALVESLNSSDVDERKVMEEALKNLNINLDEGMQSGESGTLFNEVLESGSAKLECNSQTTMTDKLMEAQKQEQAKTVTKEASNVGSDGLVESLQAALKAKSDSDAKVQSLQSEIAVSNTKVNELNEELGRYKSTTARLSTLVKGQEDLAKEVAHLKEELEVKNKTIQSQEEKIKELSESKEADSTANKTLTESLSGKDNEIAKLNESLAKADTEHKAEIQKLTESFNKEKQAQDAKIKGLNEQLTAANNLTEGYKGLANKAVNKYIDTKAIMLGVTSTEIKNKLPKRYTLKDIDSICESLKTYVLNINNLPFSTDRKVSKVTVSKSVNESLQPSNPLIDDSIDDSLSLSVLEKSK